MAESDPAYARLTEISKRVESLEKTVSSLADTEASRQDVVDHLTRSNTTPARVLLCVSPGKTQQGIRAEYLRRWGAVSVRTIGTKLTELTDLRYIERSDNKGAEGYTYKLSARITYRVVKELERASK